VGRVSFRLSCFLIGLLQQDESSGGPPLSEQQAAADASFIVVAGSDTVSQGTTALFRHIVGNGSIQTRLRSEINAAFDIGDDLDSLKLARLPYLDACVQEMLRLVPPIAAGTIPGCSRTRQMVWSKLIGAYDRTSTL
jgi:cytochrome P450